MKLAIFAVTVFIDRYTKLTRAILVTKVSLTTAVTVLVDNCVIPYGIPMSLLKYKCFTL